MAARKRRTVRATVSKGWTLTAAAPRRRGRRAAGPAPDGAIGALLEAGGLELVETYEAAQPARRSLDDNPLVLDVKPPDDGDYVAITRLPSGAVRFSFAEEGRPVRGGRRGRRGAARSLTFRVDVRSSAPVVAGRRGLGKKIVKFFLVKIVGKVVDAALEMVARLFEEAKWKLKKLPKGLQRIEVRGGGLALSPVKDPNAMLAGKCLLLVHGTFSHAASSFGKLATTIGSGGETFFDALRGQYRGGIYAFNHFTISKDPAENAKELLAALPANGPVLFDAITHSRGALVLRSLLERGSNLPHIERFALERGVLVAGPNQGTPLVSTDRWKELADWLGNVIDLFPDNPFTLGVEFIIELVTWLARAVGFSLPGLAAMNPQGDFIRALQAGPRPMGQLFAIASNTEPEEGWLARAVDVGVDGFFQMANDMVVPTSGAWLIDDVTEVVPGDRIACFGLEGNVSASSGKAVNHVNYFAQRETVDVLIASLSGQPISLPVVDPAAELPTKRGRRSALRAVGRPVSRPLPSRVPSPALDAARAGAPVEVRAPAYELDEIFNLFIFQPDSAAAESVAVAAGSVGYRDEDLAEQLRAARGGEALIIGSFRNARVFAPFKLKKGSLAGRWKRLEAFHDRLKGYVNGDAGFESLPNDAALRGFGAQLFETLFPGQIRRLYDSARSEAAQRRLDVCITSNIGWVADFPWEFAFDPSRQMYLCMEEVNLLRNISTSVPANVIEPRKGKLEILVVAAQPIGAGALSIDEEASVIRRAFGQLESSGLATVTVVPRATPELLHDLLMNVDSTPVDILHFIGHGEFDDSTGFGYLLFENADGQTWRLRADNLRQIACRRGIRLIFLNACESGMGIEGSRSPLDFAQGAAPMLVAGGVPAVVANQFKVLDLSATAFAQRFYSGLAAGLTIANAAREARVAVNYAIDGEAIDWAVPVVFARNPRDQLVERRVATAGVVSREAPRLAAAGPGRRGAARRRVALWDVNYLLPRIDDALARMSQAQDYFEFIRADVSAPVGTWHPRKNGDALRASLDVMSLERNLELARRRLNASHLMGLTAFPMAGAGIKENLMMHRNEDSTLSVVSIAPVADDLSEEFPVQRLLVNFLAFALCDLFEHKRGPKNCPMYFNPMNEVRWAAGPLAFCRGCSRKFKDKRLKAAIDALLGAFPGEG